MSPNLKYHLALWYTPGIGPKTFNQIVTHCQNLEAFFKNPKRYIKTLALHPKSAAYLTNYDWRPIDQALQWAQKPNQHIIAFNDNNYPATLKNISQAPPILFVHGDKSILADPQIAIVGSRRPTIYGKTNAIAFAKHFASSGITITSGLALGIDAAAHFGALEGNGKTIAILGSGIDNIQPRTNLQLAERIINNGALLSEFPLGTKADKFTFPQRNRLISGLSLGTLIVEAAQKSGSLITAKFAMEQGREVFAIPGSIHNPLSKGCHTLIRQGAKLIDNANDVLVELAPYLNEYLQQKTPSSPMTSSNNLNQLDQEYNDILQFIDYDTTPIDLIIEQSGKSVEVVSSMLLMLELQGYIASAPGGYVKIRQ